MRPHIRFLSDELLQQILDEARDLLAAVGVEIHNPAVVDLLHAGGARVDAATGRVHLPGDLVDRALATAPAAFRLYDATSEATRSIPARCAPRPAAAIYLLDEATRTVRLPVTADYVRYAKLVSRLPHIASQSTAMIAADVHEQIGDSYRLYLSLMYCEKPVITGAFSAEGFPVMRDLLVAARGTAESLRERPLAVFSCCPTAPLKWSGATSQNVVDCARAGIPVEYVSMPLAGFMAPVTLTGSLVQHTAETLSGIVISQLAAPGAPALYGGSPAIFDVRYETTPMGAIETMMMDCAYSEIGHRLGLPTQAYIGTSDAKLLDAGPAGRPGSAPRWRRWRGSTAMSGPGMLDFESCQVWKNSWSTTRSAPWSAPPRRDRAARRLSLRAAVSGAAPRGAPAHRRPHPAPPAPRAPLPRAGGGPRAALALAGGGSVPLGERARAEVARHLAAWGRCGCRRRREAALTLRRMTAEAGSSGWTGCPITPAGGEVLRCGSSRFRWMRWCPNPAPCTGCWVSMARSRRADGGAARGRPRRVPPPGRTARTLAGRGGIELADLFAAGRNKSRRAAGAGVPRRRGARCSPPPWRPRQAGRVAELFAAGDFATGAVLDAVASAAAEQAADGVERA